MITFVVASCCTKVSAQAHKDAMPPRINLDSLSPEDQALLLLYKDSFNQDVQDFLFVLNDSKRKPFDTTVYNMDKSSHVEVSLDFTSRILSNGRDVGVKGVFFAPSLAYFHKSGWYLGTSLGFYTDKSITKLSPVPLAVIATGYQHMFFRRWFISAGFSRSVTTYGNKVSRSLLVNNVSVSTAVDMWKHLIIGGGVYFNWSTVRLSRVALLSFETHSVEIAVSLRKEFIIYKFIGAKVFTITPAITAYFGNDNQVFGLQQRTKGDSSETRALLKFARQIKTFFGVLDVEPSLTIDWRIRNLDIFATPILAIPFNTFDTTSGNRTSNPKEYRFYVQAGIKYLFNVKKKKRKP
ncbi:MAG: hypothetical protein JWO06_374 [Bacteroidota bacterium]|nr:hypothetical protein [Bacteroidota bacterium]